MQALPTSLIVVGLVAAWLVVLVPMVARRREHVPESDEGNAGFRVLRRASASLRRRRPVMSRSAVRADGNAEMVGDDVRDEWADDGWDRPDDDGGDEPLDVGSDADLDADVDAGTDAGVDTAFDDAGADYSDDGAYARRARAPRVDDERLRPVPVRPGRGGFDPEAAEQAKAYRYRRRRRISVTLLAIAAICAVLGLLGLSTAWAGAAVAAVLLVLYLAYLRRQVRIEESIRQRRAARLERARQIRPVYRPSVAEQVRAHRTGGLRRPVTDDGDDGGYRVLSHARPGRSTVPPAQFRPGVVVDLDDDDPAFDDLEYYRPVIYRRAAGE